jgi:hypothetical protein
VLSVGSGTGNVCQVIVMLWVQVPHDEGYFWHSNYYSVLFVIDTLHRHFFSCFYQGYLKLAKRFRNVFATVIIAIVSIAKIDNSKLNDRLTIYTK